MNDNLFMNKLSGKMLALIVQKLLSTASLLAEAPFLTQGTVHVINELKEDTFVTYMFDIIRGFMAAIKLRSGSILVHSDVFSWVLNLSHVSRNTRFTCVTFMLLFTFNFYQAETFCLCHGRKIIIINK